MPCDLWGWIGFAVAATATIVLIVGMLAALAVWCTTWHEIKEERRAMRDWYATNAEKNRACTELWQSQAAANAADQVPEFRRELEQ